MSAVNLGEKTFPVIEIFGPVIQGEGQMAGLQTHFIRFGGCDFRCSWCDSMYAVLPEEVKKNSIKMNWSEIFTKLKALPGLVRTVTLSGGNPAMHDLSHVVANIREEGWKVIVETQGTLFPAWLAICDLITLSPKPPSSGMNQNIDSFVKGVAELDEIGMPMCLKIVVFDMIDYHWATGVMRKVHDKFGHLRISYYLQPGTSQGVTLLAAMKLNICQQMQWIARELLADDLPYVRVMPQLHALMFGYERGK